MIITDFDTFEETCNILVDPNFLQIFTFNIVRHKMIEQYFLPLTH